MGSKTHTVPQGFATELAMYLRHVLATQGREDLSGRWLEDVTEKARSRDYFSRIVKLEAAMTANDIQLFASTFGITPFGWVENTRRHASGQATLPLALSVGGVVEDGSQPHQTPKVLAAKKGNPKVDQ